MMSLRTTFLGKLFGLYLIVVSLSMLAHPQAIVNIMKAIIRDPPLLFIAGLMGMSVGLAVILAHNVWSGGALPIVVTLCGWTSFIKGILLLMLSPAAESRLFMVGLHYEQHPNFYATFALLLGAYMTWAGFRSPTRPLK